MDILGSSDVLGGVTVEIRGDNSKLKASIAESRAVSQQLAAQPVTVGRAGGGVAMGPGAVNTGTAIMGTAGTTVVPSGANTGLMLEAERYRYNSYAAWQTVENQRFINTKMGAPNAAGRPFIGSGEGEVFAGMFAVNAVGGLAQALYARDQMRKTNDPREQVRLAEEYEQSLNQSSLGLRHFVRNVAPNLPGYRYWGGSPLGLFIDSPEDQEYAKNTLAAAAQQDKDTAARVGRFKANWERRNQAMEARAAFRQDAMRAGMSDINRDQEIREGFEAAGQRFLMIASETDKLVASIKASKLRMQGRDLDASMVEFSAETLATIQQIRSAGQDPSLYIQARDAQRAAIQQRIVDDQQDAMLDNNGMPGRASFIAGRNRAGLDEVVRLRQQRADILRRSPGTASEWNLRFEARQNTPKDDEMVRILKSIDERLKALGN